MPFLAIRWWMRFYGVRTDDRDFKRARTMVIVISVLILIPILDSLARFLRPSNMPKVPIPGLGKHTSVPWPHGVDEFQAGEVLFVVGDEDAVVGFNQFSNTLSRDSAAVCFGCFDDEYGLSGQCDQVFVACDENAGLAALRKVKESLILGVTAADRASLGGINGFAIRKIIGQQL